MKSVYISGLTYIVCTGVGKTQRALHSPWGVPLYANGALSRRLEEERDGGGREKRIKTRTVCIRDTFVRFAALTRTFMKKIQPPTTPSSLSLTGTESLIFADRNRLSICYRTLFVKSNQGLTRRANK